MRVLCVLGTYPLVTTTFVDREIRALRRLGVDVQIVAVRAPAVDSPLSADQRILKRDVTYLLPFSWRTLLHGHLHFLSNSPITVLSIFFRVTSAPHPSLRARVKTILHFGEGVYAAYLVRDQSIDALHAHFADRAATIAMVAGRLLRKPYTLSVHAGADIFVEPVLLPEKVRCARRVIACTDENKARLIRSIGRDVDARVIVVPHGVDPRVYSAQTPPERALPGILSVGQLRERKGFAHLIEACEQLRNGGYKFACRIVGSGPLYDPLRARLTVAGLQGTVELCGALPHDEVIREYERATVFVLPCVEASDGDVDGVPNVLLEAMASCRPVVSSDLRAVRELVTPGFNGLLVPAGDVSALAAALGRLLDDRELRARLASNGRQTIAERFDADTNVRRLASVLWPERFATPVSNGAAE